MSATPTRLMTFAEFEQLPDPKDCRYELVHGGLVSVPPPIWKHFAVQIRLRHLLDTAAKEFIVGTEFAFQAPGANYRVADVGLVSKERWDSTDPKGYFQGSPELVIEVLSPANTATELLDKEKLCLENGCREFWLVDTERQQIKVSTPDGLTIAYRSGQKIPLFFAVGAKLLVDEIFR